MDFPNCFRIAEKISIFLLVLVMASAAFAQNELNPRGPGYALADIILNITRYHNGTEVAAAIKSVNRLANSPHESQLNDLAVAVIPCVVEATTKDQFSHCHIPSASKFGSHYSFLVERLNQSLEMQSPPRGSWAVVQMCSR